MAEKGGLMGTSHLCFPRRRALGNVGGHGEWARLPRKLCMDRALLSGETEGGLMASPIPKPTPLCTAAEFDILGGQMSLFGDFSQVVLRTDGQMSASTGPLCHLTQHSAPPERLDVR